MNGSEDFGHLELAMVEGVPLEADVALAYISHKRAFPQVQQVVTFLTSQRPLVIIVGVGVDTLSREPLQSTLLARARIILGALLLSNYYPTDATLGLQLWRL